MGYVFIAFDVVISCIVAHNTGEPETFVRVFMLTLCYGMATAEYGLSISVLVVYQVVFASIMMPSTRQKWLLKAAMALSEDDQQELLQQAVTCLRSTGRDQEANDMARFAGPCVPRDATFVTSLSSEGETDKDCRQGLRNYIFHLENRLKHEEDRLVEYPTNPFVQQSRNPAKVIHEQEYIVKDMKRDIEWVKRILGET